jgi:hypothetical protein
LDLIYLAERLKKDHVRAEQVVSKPENDALWVGLSALSVDLV